MELSSTYTYTHTQQLPHAITKLSVCKLEYYANEASIKTIDVAREIEDLVASNTWVCPLLSAFPKILMPLVSLGRSGWDAHDLITQHVWYNLEHRSPVQVVSNHRCRQKLRETTTTTKSKTPHDPIWFSRNLIVNVNAIIIIFSCFFVLHNIKTKEAKKRM